MTQWSWQLLFLAFCDNQDQQCIDRLQRAHIALISTKHQFLRHSVRVGFCSRDLSSFNELCTQADQNMFTKVLNNTDHVLHHLLTPLHNTSHSYSDRVHMIENCQIVLRI